MSEADLLLRHDAGGVAFLTLNRPQARNSLSRALLHAVAAELQSINDDRSVRVVVLTGAGTVFCAGHDLKEMRQANFAEDFCADLFALCGRVMQGLIGLRQPVIAKIRGMATAAGCQLVASCDLAIAETGARFATPGVDIGLFCSTPMVALSRSIGRKAAMAMLLTGDPIDAATAAGLGLINQAVPDNELDAHVAHLANTIAAKSAITVALGKAAFYRQIEMSLAEAYAHTAQVMAANLKTTDAKEGITAFLEKRPPHWIDE